MTSRSSSPICPGVCASGVPGWAGSRCSTYLRLRSKSSLTVGEVDAVFAHVAGLSGAGSTAARAAAVDALLARATADEQDLLRGLVFGELRQGAMEAAVQEGLAAAFDVPVAAVRRAAMLMSSTTAAAAVLLTGGLEALQAVGLQVGVAIQPMLAASAPGPDAALDKTGLPAVVDYKLDGVRVQVHRAWRGGTDLHPQPGRHHRAASRGGGGGAMHFLMISSCSMARCSRCVATVDPRPSRSWRPAP